MSNTLAIKTLSEDYLNYIPQAAIITNDPDKNINNLNIYVEDNVLCIKWDDPKIEHWEKNYVTKTENYIPADPRVESILVQYNTKNQFSNQPLLVSDIEPNKLYYFRIFTQFSNDPSFYSGYKNIFAVYVYDTQSGGSDPNGNNPGGNDPGSGGGTPTDPNEDSLVQMLRQKMITALNGIDEIIPANATWDEVSNTINNIQNNKRYIDFDINMKLYHDPLLVDFSNIQQNPSVIHTPVYLSVGYDFSDISDIFDKTVICPDKLFSPTKSTNNISSQSLNSNLLNNVQTINNISMSILPPINSMCPLIVDSNIEPNLDAIRCVNGNKYINGIMSTSVNIAFNKDYHIYCQDSNISIVKNSTNQYVLDFCYNNAYSGNYDRYSGHFKNFYYNIINDKFYIYFEKQNYSNQDMVQASIVIDSNFNMQFYTFNSFSQTYNGDFTITDQNGNQNTITISNMTSNTLMSINYTSASYVNSTISSGPFDKISINKFIYYDNIQNQFYRYDSINDTFGIISTSSNLVNDINMYGDYLPDIGLIKFSFTNFSLVYNSQYFNILNINSTDQYNTIESNQVIDLSSVSKIQLNAINATNEKILLNIDGQLKTYSSGNLIDVESKDSILTNGIPLSDISNIDFTSLTGNATLIIGYDNTSTLQFVNPVIISNETFIDKTLLATNENLQFALMGSLLSSMWSPVACNTFVGLQKDSYLNNVIDTKLLPLTNSSILSAGPYNNSSGQIPATGILNYDNILSLLDFNYGRGANPSLSNFTTQCNSIYSASGNSLQHDFKNITINDKYNYLSILLGHQFVQKSYKFDFTPFGNYVVLDQMCIISNDKAYTIAYEDSYDPSNIAQSGQLFILDLNTQTIVKNVLMTDLLGSLYNYATDFTMLVNINEQPHLFLINIDNLLNGKITLFKINADYSLTKVNDNPFIITCPTPENDEPLSIQQIAVVKNKLYILWSIGLYTPNCEPYYTIVDLNTSTIISAKQELSDFIKNAYLQTRDTWLLPTDKNVYIMQYCKDDYVPYITAYNCDTQQFINNWNDLEFTLTSQVGSQYSEINLPNIALAPQYNNLNFVIEQDNEFTTTPQFNLNEVTTSSPTNTVVIKQIVPYQRLTAPYQLPNYFYPAKMDLTVTTTINPLAEMFNFINIKSHGTLQ